MPRLRTYVIDVIARMLKQEVRPDVTIIGGDVAARRWLPLEEFQARKYGYSVAEICYDVIQTVS